MLISSAHNDQKFIVSKRGWIQQMDMAIANPSCRLQPLIMAGEKEEGLTEHTQALVPTSYQVLAAMA